MYLNIYQWNCNIFEHISRICACTSMELQCKSMHFYVILVVFACISLVFPYNLMMHICISRCLNMFQSILMNLNIYIKYQDKFQ
jgi:hypothetical protein